MFTTYAVKLIEGQAVRFSAVQGGRTPAQALARLLGGAGLCSLLHRTGPSEWRAEMGDMVWVVSR